MNEIQEIILTCLLGPEDKTAFSRFQKNVYERERLKTNPRVFSEAERQRRRDQKNKRYRDNPEPVRQYVRDIRKNFPEKVREQDRARRAENPEKHREQDRALYAKNPEKFRARSLKRRKEFPEVIREGRRKNQARASETAKKRYHSDLQYKLGKNLRSRINSALKNGKAGKSVRTMELLGCPWVWAEVHLESLFKPGMTWENHGSVWEIDHIKPCAAFDLTDPEQQKICFHWTNLQPLTVHENRKKSDTYNV